MSWHEGLKKFTSEISGRYKFFHGKKGKLEKPYQKLKHKIPDGVPGEISRIAGLGAIDLSWFLFCLGKYTAKDLNSVFLDNKIIDKLQTKKENISIKDRDSKFKQFFKNLQKSYPRIAATLHLWMLYTLFAGMAVGVYHKDDIKESVNEFIYKIKSGRKMNFANYREKLSPITPWLVAELIAAEGVQLDEYGLHKPYKDGNGIWTIGFGSTQLKDGSPVKPNTPHITTEEAYELARWHLEEHETFFDLFCYGAYDNNLLPRNTGEAFGLASIVYNSGTKFIENKEDLNHKKRFNLLRNEYKTYGSSINDSIIIAAFDRYPVRDKMVFGRAWIDSGNPMDMANAIGLYMKDGGGMHWRRWLEAGLITGDIIPEDLLECPIGGMYDFYLYMGGWQKDKKACKYALWEDSENGLTPKKSTYTDFKLWLQNPKTKEKYNGKERIITRKKVKDFIPNDIVQGCMNGKCEIGSFSNQTETKTVAFNNGINRLKNKKQSTGNFIVNNTSIRNG